MTHILFVTPYYPPEISAPAVRISETAMRLVKRGHHVTVLTTFPNFPYGVVNKCIDEVTIDVFATQCAASKPLIVGSYGITLWYLNRIY